MSVVKESQTKRILKLLREKGTVTNVELNRICFRYGARIYELRKDGHVIVTNRVREGVFEFTLQEETA